jgi:hypothetical protein
MTTVNRCSLAKYILSVLLVTVLHNKTLAQLNHRVDSLLLLVYNTDSSKQIAGTEAGQRLMAYGYHLLPMLTMKFYDTTVTGVASSCVNRFLTRGEVAIILADRIEGMPYCFLTGVQNCLLQFCGPNKIETYLWWIRRNGIATFAKKYRQWLNSADRNTWPWYVNNKNKKYTAL